MFKDKIPFLAAPLPTQSQPVIQASPTVPVPIPTATMAVVSQPIGTDTLGPTDTPVPSPTATVPSLPILGGADLIAFLSNKDIWLVNVDGTGLSQLTKDASDKHDLQWAPDGKSLFYIGGTCIYSVTVPEGVSKSITCFPGAKYLEAFEISPDGSQVAISLDRVLYIVPLDVTQLSGASNKSQLMDIKGITFTYTELAGQLAIKKVRWSSNGKEIAVSLLTPSADLWLDVIAIYDISNCTSTTPCNSSMYYKDTFPASRFSMIGYGISGGKSPIIPSFDWNGKLLFLLNSIIRNGVYGYLYNYNASNKIGEEINPLGSCCYADVRWSPDGTYVLFSYQDMGLGSASSNQLYYIPYGSIGTGEKYTPLPLPGTILANVFDHPDPALRPVK